MTRPVITDFKSYSESVPEALDSVGCRQILRDRNHILLKPNLVNASPFPITTPAELCAAVIEYIRKWSEADIVIAEGCGDKDLETDEIFDILGYRTLSKDYGVPLIDLNHEPLLKKNAPECPFFPEMYLPEIAFTHFIISLPVLKAHSLSEITGTLKNMVGFAPPKHYSGKFGIWKKAIFHEDPHQAISDLNSYRTPDLTLLDASVGMAEYHLGGPECNPPVNKLVAGTDPVEVDKIAAGLLGLDWNTIPHLLYRK